MNAQITSLAAAYATAPELHAIRDALIACRDELAGMHTRAADDYADRLAELIVDAGTEIEDAPMHAMADAADAYADYRRDMDHDR